MHCRHCGKQIDDDSQFCDFCGISVKKYAKKSSARIVIPVCAGILIITGIAVGFFFMIKGKNAGNAKRAANENPETFPPAAYDSWLKADPEAPNKPVMPAETESSPDRAENSVPAEDPSRNSESLPPEETEPQMQETESQETESLDPTEVPPAGQSVSQPEEETVPPETQPADVPVISGFDSSFWGQDFYGFIQLTNGTGQFSGHDGKEDFLMLSECDGGSGRFRLVAESCEENRIVGECRFDLTDGVTGRGMLKSNYVLFNGQEGEYWEADPGTGFSQLFGDMITFGGKFVADSGSFDYTFFLKPWGSRWEDVQAAYPDLMPRHYSDWYLPKTEAGEQAPSYFH